MRAYDVIRKKRDGEELSDAEIKYMIAGFTADPKDPAFVADYQMAALAMAIFWRGMSPRELSALTSAMLHSGQVLDLKNVPAFKVDKHSTGGVGDKISLPLAPAVAALGVPVPMVSGRGLGHTGGTLDKLESIPGFNVNLSSEKYAELVEKVGLCLIGQTKEIAPADKKLYALRDVTATVNCIPLIASSIMSKKLAEGIDGLVLDVKYGSGAFMKKLSDAEELAQTMVAIGAHMGKRVVARMTSMDQPIGTMVGNSLEVIESLDILEGKGPADTVALTVELGAEMLVLGQKAHTLDEGRSLMQQVLQDGRAKKKFAEIVEAQGGNPEALDNRALLPTAKHRKEFVAQKDGYIYDVISDQVGIASMLLGGGRRRAEDSIDHSVGIEIYKRIGDVVKAGEPIALLHHNDMGVEDALAVLQQAYIIDPSETVLTGGAAGELLRAPALFGKRFEK